MDIFALFADDKIRQIEKRNFSNCKICNMFEIELRYRVMPSYFYLHNVPFHL